MRGVGQEDAHAEAAEEAGGGAADGAGGPLALGLQAQVRAGFLEGDFDVPPVEVRGQVCSIFWSGLSLTFGEARCKDPSRRQFRLPASP